MKNLNYQHNIFIPRQTYLPKNKSDGMQIKNNTLYYAESGYFENISICRVAIYWFERCHFRQFSKSRVVSNLFSVNLTPICINKSVI